MLYAIFGRDAPGTLDQRLAIRPAHLERVNALLNEGHAERLAAREMIEAHADRPYAITLGADKGYDSAGFVDDLREMNVRPHVAAKSRGSAVDGRTTRHVGYKM